MPLPNGASPPTDTTLHDLASKAYDDAEAAMGDTSPPIARDDDAGASDDGAAAPEPKAGKDSASDGDKPKYARSKEDRGDGRRPDGKFARKPADEAAAAEPDGAEESEGEPTEQEVVPSDQSKSPSETSPAPDAVTEVRGAPPPGWTIKSKSQWDKLPAEIRADIIKREQEVDNGFKMYEGVRPYAERARQQGQSLDQALHAYTAIEDLFRRDVSSGFLHVAQNSGMTQHEAGQTFLNLAMKLGAMPPQSRDPSFGAAPQMGQPQLAPGDQNAPGGSVLPQGGAADPQAMHQQLMGALEQMLPRAVGPLAQRLEQLETERRQQAEAAHGQRVTASTKVVAAFRQDPANRYYADVESEIEGILQSPLFQKTGDFAADLKRAYDDAVWRHPEIREHLITERTAKSEADRRTRDREAAAKAKAAGKSVTGAPSAGAKVSAANGKGNFRPNENDRLRALAEQAFNDASGRV